MSSSSQALIVCNDLFFSTQLHGAAKKAGLTAKTALSPSQAVQLLGTETFAWTVVDLELPQLDLPEMCRTAKGAGSRVVAFGPHVHETLLKQAKESGCDVVLTRGQASAALDEVLAS